MPSRLNVLPAIALGAMAIAAAGTAWGQAPVAGKPSVACYLMGHDLVVINRGAAPLAAGTVVKWSVPDVRVSGQRAVDAELVPEVGQYLIGELGANYLWEKTCVAEVLPADAAAIAPARTQ